MDPTELFLRLEGKLDKLDERFDKSDRRLDRYNDLLDTHIKRTDTLEDAVGLLEKDKGFILTTYKVLFLIATVGAGVLGAFHFVLERH